VPRQHLSIRLEDELLGRLDAEGRRTGRSRSEVAKTLIEEGLRMEAHPGIVFRPGPTGRRPGLAGGPDVWEVARVLRQVQGEAEDVIRRTAELTGLTSEQVRAALGYYADFRDEIDAWMQRVDEEAERQETAWRRQQALLQG
jgi:uncharacterized protein (DUF433 family)